MKRGTINIVEKGRLLNGNNRPSAAWKWIITAYLAYKILAVPL
jgi:hypothetical protein